MSATSSGTPSSAGGSTRKDPQNQRNQIIPSVNIWQLYHATSIQKEEETFTKFRVLDFLESPFTKKVYVQEPVGANHVNFRISGSCPDELGFDVDVSFRTHLNEKELDEEEKKRVLRIIGAHWPARVGPMYKMKQSVAKALNIPRFF